MFRRDVIVILMAGAAFFLMLGYYAYTGAEVPLWQALLVIVVNLVAAAKLFFSVRNARAQQQQNLRNGADKGQGD